MASISLPVGESSACSVIETTRIPLRRSMDLKATACSRLRVKRENFQTRITWNGDLALPPSSIILRNWGPIGDAATLGLVDVLPGHRIAVVPGVVPECPELGRYGEVHVLAVAGDPRVEGRGVWVVVTAPS